MMCNKTQYECAICGKTYDAVQERINCETKCLKKKQEEAKAAAEAKKKEEQETRQQEVSAALDNVYALVNKYIEDYGSFEYTGKYKGLDMLNLDFFPSKLWHHFWF